MEREGEGGTPPPPLDHRSADQKSMKCGHSEHSADRTLVSPTNCSHRDVWVSNSSARECKSWQRSYSGRRRVFLVDLVVAEVIGEAKAAVRRGGSGDSLVWRPFHLMRRY